jgi:hypothetical protein
MKKNRNIPPKLIGLYRFLSFLNDTSESHSVLYLVSLHLMFRVLQGPCLELREPGVSPGLCRNGMQDCLVSPIARRT